MAEKALNVYVCGVGGFGIGSVTKILTEAARLMGKHVAGSETHGLAQRGGVVVSTVRIGDKIEGSPLIINGSADIVIALEPLEALRAMPVLKKGGTVIYNTAGFQPLSVRIGRESSPTLEEIEAELKRVTANVIPIDASAKAKELGLSQAANVVLIGALAAAGSLPFDIGVIKRAVEKATPGRFLDANLQALEAGFAAVA